MYSARCHTSTLAPFCNSLFTPGRTLLMKIYKIYIWITLTKPWSANVGARDKEYLDSSLTSVSSILVFQILAVGSSDIRYWNFFSLTADEVHFTPLIRIGSCQYCTQDNNTGNHKLHSSLRAGISSAIWCLFHTHLRAAIITQRCTVTLYAMSSFETVSSSSLPSAST